MQQGTSKLFANFKNRKFSFQIFHFVDTSYCKHILIALINVHLPSFIIFNSHEMNFHFVTFLCTEFDVH